MSILGIALACLLLGSVAGNASTVFAMNEGLGDLGAVPGQQALGAMQASRAKLVRFDASWGSGQPSAPSSNGPGYQFAQFDTLVSELASHGMTWLPIIDYSTPWDESVAGDPFSPPAADAPYAAYAQAIAARYGDSGSFWTANPQLPYEPVQTFEVWNEENTSMFWGASDPARYALLYMQTRAAIHAVDPSAQVIVGGLLEILPGPASQYVQAMFRAQPSLRGNVDGFALHPYGPNAAGVLTNVSAFRKTLDALGEAAAPIDVTEFGWGSGAGESWRAAQMHAVAVGLANSDCGIGEISPYVWYEQPGSGANYSLGTLSGLLPSGQAWISGLSAAARSPEQHLCHPVARKSQKSPRRRAHAAAVGRRASDVQALFVDRNGGHVGRARPPLRSS